VLRGICRCMASCCLEIFFQTTAAAGNGYPEGSLLSTNLGDTHVQSIDSSCDPFV